MSRHLSRAHRAAISRGLHRYWRGFRRAAAAAAAVAAAARSRAARKGWETRRRNERRELRKIGAARREAERQIRLPTKIPFETLGDVSMPLIVNAAPSFAVWDDPDNVLVGQTHLAEFYKLAKNPDSAIVRVNGHGQLRRESDIAFEEDADFVFQPAPEWEQFKSNYYEAVRQYIAVVREEVLDINENTSAGFVMFTSAIEISES
jgi:hypothetical protein